VTARAPALLAALAAALGAGGCGTDLPETGTTQSVRSAVQTFLTACGEQRGDAAYDLLARDEKRTFLEAGGPLDACEQVVRFRGGVRGPDEFLRARVSRVHVVGNVASATVRSGPLRSSVRVYDTGERWLIANPPTFQPVSTDIR
jgi:hypothetical protein